MNTKELLEAWNVSRGTIERYRKLGMPFKKISNRAIEYNYKECCEWREQKRKEIIVGGQPKLKIKYNGKEMFLKDFCDELDLDYNIVYRKYIKYNGDVDEMFKDRLIRVTYEGEKLTIRELSERTGVPVHNLYVRYKKFGDDYKSLTRKNYKRIKYKGEELTVKELSERTNTPIQTIYGRIRRYNEIIRK